MFSLRVWQGSRRLAAPNAAVADSTMHYLKGTRADVRGVPALLFCDMPAVVHELCYACVMQMAFQCYAVTPLMHSHEVPRH